MSIFGDPGPELLVAGTTSAHVRAELVTCPERRRADGSPVQIEVRAVPLADRVRYVGIIATTDEYEDPDTDLLYPALVIPACWSPAFDAAGEWVPHASTTRVFRPGDDEAVLALPATMLDALFSAAADLSGIRDGESKRWAVRLILDGQLRSLFRIADAWHMPLSELMQRMPSWELTAWSAFYSLEAADREVKSGKGGTGGGTDHAAMTG